jgi:phage gpG-like protein
LVNIKVDTKDFEEKIKNFREDMPKIAKKLMTYVFSKMRTDIRRNIKSNFKRRKGWLLADVNYWAFDDFSGAVFTRNSKRQGVNYASLLENRAVITPKKGKYLAIYQGMMTGKNGERRPILKQVESVTIPQRPFFGPVVNDYWGGGGYKASQLMDEGLKKEIKKYIEKQGGGLRIPANTRD